MGSDRTRTRVYLEPGQLDPNRLGEPLALDARAARHLNVLRISPASEIIIFDGSGREYRATVAEISKRRSVVVPSAFVTIRRESPLHTTLGIGVSRGDRMDFAIQKAVELGVSAVVPLLTEHSVVKLDSSRAERRHRHWQEIIVSACEQSGRSILPSLQAPCRLTAWLPDLPASDDCPRYYFHPSRDLIGEPTGAPAPLPVAPPPGVILAVGPEGGFSPSEVTQFEGAGFRGLLLGPRILRTETAGASAVLWAQLRWGDMDPTRTPPSRVNPET